MKRGKLDTIGGKAKEAKGEALVQAPDELEWGCDTDHFRELRNSILWTFYAIVMTI